LIYYFPEEFNADGPTSGLYYFFIFSSLLAYTVYRIIKRRNNNLIDRLSNRIVEIEGEIYKRRDRFTDVKGMPSTKESAINDVPMQTQTIIEPTIEPDSGSDPAQYQPEIETATESNTSSEPDQFRPVKESSTESNFNSDPDQIQLNFNQ
jgi:hypothetical protein